MCIVVERERGTLPTSFAKVQLHAVMQKKKKTEPNTRAKDREWKCEMDPSSCLMSMQAYRIVSDHKHAHRGP